MELAAPVSAERHEHERDRRRALALGVLRGQAVQRREEAVHERGVRLDGLLARGAAQVGGAEKSHVRVEVLTEQIEPEPAAPVRPLGGACHRSPSPSLGLGAADLAVEFRRHGETLQPRRRYCQTRRELGANLPVPRPACYNEPPMRRLWRAVLDEVAPYDAGKSLEAIAKDLGIEDLIRLSANESPLGPSPRAIEALRREAPRAHLYPDGGSTAAAGHARRAARCARELAPGGQWGGRIARADRPRRLRPGRRDPRSLTRPSSRTARRRSSPARRSSRARSWATRRTSTTCSAG